MNRQKSKKSIPEGGINWTGIEEIGPALNLDWIGKAVRQESKASKMLHDITTGCKKEQEPLAASGGCVTVNMAGR